MPHEPPEFSSRLLAKTVIPICVLATVAVAAARTGHHASNNDPLTTDIRASLSAQTPTVTRPTGGGTMVEGLGTVIYHVTDLNRAKAWYSKAFQQEPCFDQPFYVGFNVAGYELGLDPDSAVSKPGPGGGVAYWRVARIEDAVQHFVTAGATVVAPAKDVGDGIKVATVADPFGNLIGVIENPHFALPK